MKVTLKDENISSIPANQMSIGEIGIIEDIREPNYIGFVVLMAYDKLVSLSNPAYTWSKDVSLKVKLLFKGAKVILEVE